MTERPKYQVMVLERVRAGLRRFGPVLGALSGRLANESDTVAAITDILADAFGWQKYVDITSETRIKGQFCDLALRQGDRIVAVLEAKAINTPLNQGHLLQAIAYAANQGVDWIILTNGIHWKLYRLIVGKPLDHQLVAEFQANDPGLQDDDFDDMDAPWLLTKEAFERNEPQATFERLAAINGPNLVRLLLSPPVLKRLRLEVREQTGFNVSNEEIERLLGKLVIRPEMLPQVVVPSGQDASGGPASGSRPPSESSIRSRIDLSDLITANVLRDGERLRGIYKGVPVEATIRAPHGVEVLGGVYDSLSEATLPILRQHNQFNARNGWTFWSVERDGRLVTLAELRTAHEKATGA